MVKDYGRGIAVREGWVFRRGGIYVANLNPFRGSEQGGTRPVLILQNNTGNIYCPTVIIAPITSKIDRKGKETHYLLENQRGLRYASIVELEQIRAIDKTRIRTYLGHVGAEDMRRIDDVIERSLGMHVEEDVPAP